MKLIICVLFLFLINILIVSALPSSTLFHKNGKSAENWDLIVDNAGKTHLINYIEDKNVGIAPTFNAIEETIFRLYTRTNRAGEIVYLNDVQSLQNSSFNIGHPTRIIIHGFGTLVTWAGGDVLRNTYLDRGNFNVIMVDWTAGASDPNYARARGYIMSVGDVSAQFIDFLFDYGVTLESITVVGFSLGAHAAGVTGKRVTRGTLPTIIALDPARSLFALDRPNERVAFDDALYVEVISTSAGEVGFEQPLGRATFYPGWGTRQPGCGPDLGCNHLRAVDYLIESITTTIGFWGVQCRDFLDIVFEFCPSSGPRRVMGGEPANNIAEGVFYVDVNAVSPFANGI